MARRKNRKVVRYRKQVHINVGVVVFIIIFIYLVLLCLQFFQTDKISFYEVVEKSISDDNTFEGLILRDETVYYTDTAGYVNYYIGDGERAAKGATIYTVDETGDVYKQLVHADQEDAVSAYDTEAIQNTITAFHHAYSDSNYVTALDFKYDIENTILKQDTESLVSSLDQITKKTRSDFDIVMTKKSGIVSYTMDGMENLTKKKITAELFKQKQDNREQLRKTEAVKEGSPAYKLITSEKWSIIIPFTKEQYKSFQETEQVFVGFPKSGQTVTAGISVFEQAGGYYGQLSLDQYMDLYRSDRYIEVELKVNKADGLKIPVSSIVTKEFYLAPKSYVTVGGKTNSMGVTKKVTDEETKKISYEFVPVTVFLEQDGMYYIEADDLSGGDTILNEKEKEYQLSKTGSLEGVYNVNKGYAVFRVIEKIYENKEYVIVNEGTPYGLAIYDHIVVNADKIEESQIIK